MAVKFPPSQQAQAFRALEKVLKADPYLQAGVETWRTWSGQTEDPADITLKHCPAIRLTPSVDEAKWATNVEHEANVKVTYELYVSGTNIDDLFAFNEAVVRAIFPIDGTRKEALSTFLQSYGVGGPNLGPFAVGTDTDGNDGGLYLHATGEILINFYLGT